MRSFFMLMDVLNNESLFCFLFISKAFRNPLTSKEEDFLKYKRGLFPLCSFDLSPCCFFCLISFRSEVSPILGN